MQQSCFQTANQQSGSFGYDGIPSKFSSQSSSKQTTTCQAFAGEEDGVQQHMNYAVDSSFHPGRMIHSPFNVHGSPEVAPMERSNSGMFAITPPESCTEEDLKGWPLAKHGPSKHHNPDRTKSKLLSEIADEISRNHSQAPRHSRKSSADSQDSVRRGRKRRAWQLAKAFSAPGEEMYLGLDRGGPWDLHSPCESPCESGNWAQRVYHNEQHPTAQSHLNTIPTAMRGRQTTRKRYSGRYRTSRFIGVGSSNRKTQWQARILVQGKVTHLGYYATEEEAARIYDKVALSLNPTAQTNFPASHYPKGAAEFSGLGREDLQRALGVKPMDKSSRFRGVSRKKGKWEAKVMVNRKWAYRALFDSEDEAAHAYDAAVRRLKPREATSFVNFKDGVNVRDSPAKSSSKSPNKPILERQMSPEIDAVKIEQDTEPLLGTTDLTLTEMNIPLAKEEPFHLEVTDQFPVEPTDQFPEVQPLRTQSIQLPVFRPEMAPSASCVMPPLAALTPTPSLPAELDSGLAVPGPPSHSPQRSAVDQSGLQSLPLTALAPLSVSMNSVPHLDLPDPNSIAVPPSEHLPFPELASGGGAELVAHGVAPPPRSLTSTPTQSMGNPKYFAQQAHSSPHASTSGLPPLPGRSSLMTSESPARFMSGNLGAMNVPQTCSPFTEMGSDPQNLMNPFTQANSLPLSVASADLCTLPNITPLERHPSMVASPHLQRAATDSFLHDANLPYTGGPHEVVGIGGNLSHVSSLVSVDTAQYLHPAQGTMGTPSMSTMYTGANLSQIPSTGLSAADSAYSYDPLQTLANSRSASSNFLQAARTASNGLHVPMNASPRRTSSIPCSSLPMLSGSELAALGHSMTTLPRHLSHAVSMDASFLARPEMLEAQLMKPGACHLPDVRPLNPEQADLLQNLDVDVEANDPVPINPVQIGGEDMNVYSAHIMGNFN